MKINCNWNTVFPSTLPEIPLQQFSQVEDENIITASLMMPFDDIHSSYDIGGKRSKTELKKRFKHLLTTPPRRNLEHLSPKTKINFTYEEDFWIYTYLTKYQDQDMTRILKLFKDKFYPIRTEKDILNRIEEIKSQTPEENEMIISNFANQILHDKLVSDGYENKNHSPIVDQQRCLKLIEDTPPFTRDDEIDELYSYFPEMAQSLFDSHQLAALVSENYVIKMNSSRFTIGYSHMCETTDFDMRLASETNCCHISKKQAIISFLPDGKFYIENIGSAVFRVNGVIIPPYKCALLPDLALLDFCDNLYIFVPNTVLVNKIYTSYLQALKASKKKKGVNQLAEYDSRPEKPELQSITLPNGVIIPASEV